MDRRAFLKSVGVAAGALGTAGVLGACGREAGSPAAGAPTTGGATGPIPNGQPTLSVVTGSFETLTGTDRQIAFGVRTIDNTPIEGADLDVYLRDPEGSILSGPHAPEFADDRDSGLGVYLVTLDLPEAGTPLLVAVRDDEYGEAALRVVEPSASQLPVPGQEAISVATPTVAHHRGMAQLCTAEPDCGMHAVSLDDALAKGRPTVLLFATPAYCQTAVCGPAVSTVDAVRRRGDWGDTAFVHVEIYADEGQTVAEPVRRWELPTEPWLFTIGADGTIRDRLDGPMVASVVEDMVADVAAA